MINFCNGVRALQLPGQLPHPKKSCVHQITKLCDTFGTRISRSLADLNQMFMRPRTLLKPGAYRASDDRREYESQQQKHKFLVFPK